MPLKRFYDALEEAEKYLGSDTIDSDLARTKLSELESLMKEIPPSERETLQVEDTLRKMYIFLVYHEAE